MQTTPSSDPVPSATPDPAPAGTLGLFGQQSTVYASVYYPPGGGKGQVAFSSSVAGRLYAGLSWAAPTVTSSIKINFMLTDIESFSQDPDCTQITFDPVAPDPLHQSASVVPSSADPKDCHFSAKLVGLAELVDPVIVITVKPKDPDPT